MFGAIAGGIASALAGGAMSKLFGGGQKAASGGIQGDVLATDNNTVGMGDAGIKSAIQGSNVPNPDEAVLFFSSRGRHTSFDCDWSSDVCSSDLEPLENERQYIVYDEQRGNLLIDAPPFSERALRLVRGAGPASLLVATNAARAADAGKYREALGLQVAAHADDADGIPGGPDLVLGDDELVRPDARAVRVHANGEGATVLLLRKAGGVLVCGDLDLASDAARALLPLSFSVVLSARRSPMWNAGKDILLALQDTLPKPRKQFGILLQAPWDRAYKGRLEDKLVPHDPIVPREVTAPREAAM